MKDKFRVFKTREKRKNDIEVIINGDGASEIAAELKLALKKIQRKHELSYYMVIRK